jgi:hypothetical protein
VDLMTLRAARDRVPAEARRAARSETARTAEQQRQLGRLVQGTATRVVTLPFLPVAALDREQVASLGTVLAGKL